MNYLITIIGPTAIGKTALAIKLANHFQSEIISSDSRQFYKEMKIGTAVPSEKELASAKHHFIQNKSIFDSYTVGDFENEAINKLEELLKKNRIQIMVGGSGLYVDAVLKGFDQFPEIDSSVRTTINSEYKLYGIKFLQEKLQEYDPIYYNKLLQDNPQTLQNPQRMKRFVEVCLGSNQPYSSFIGKNNKTRNFTPILIGLDASRDIIYQRINLRVDLMIENGLLTEINDLIPHQELNALQTVGYKEIFEFFANKTSLEFAVEEVKKNTRRFAKRQLTWFKRYENVFWYDYTTPLEEIIEEIEKNIIS